MGLTTDGMLNNLTKPDMLKCLKNIEDYVNDEEEANTNTLKEKIKRFWENAAPGDVAWLLNDPECYYTDTEFQQKFDVFVNIQTIAEKSRLCILARCPSND